MFGDSNSFNHFGGEPIICIKLINNSYIKLTFAPNMD
jgi:hypothetical protein